MLIDYVSDIRCSTPTACGEFIGALQVKKYDITKYINYMNLLKMSITNDIYKQQSKLKILKNRLEMANPKKVIKDGYTILSRHGLIVNKLSRLKRLKKQDPELKLKLTLLDGYAYIKINSRYHAEFV